MFSKKLLFVAVASLAFAGPVSAMPSFGVVVVTTTAGYLGHNSDRILAGIPVKAHLTDACKVKTVKVADSNYSYATFEGCLKK